MNRYVFTFFCLTTQFWLIAQDQYKVYGQVLDATTKLPMSMASVLLEELELGAITDEKGHFSLTVFEAGMYTIKVSYLGYNDELIEINLIEETTPKIIYLKPGHHLLEEVVVQERANNGRGIRHLRQVDKMAIYASKKSELIILENITANKAANTSRQIFSKVSGLNIWESDGAGVQLGIGGRGLSPSRNSNFNTRQNGYDISADALGYPESYYTPPVEALERIEVVRGAASLQYGTQFGGMLNFAFREGPVDRPFELETRQTIGSFGFFSSFNSIGGSSEKIRYYSFYQRKVSSGWRPNSKLNQHTGYASLSFKISNKISLRPEYTHTQYVAQQPGGLTDAQFLKDARRSFRSRNWFAVQWNLMALSGQWNISQKVKLDTRFFGLVAGRDALGNLDNIQLMDFGEERDLLSDKFRNWGNETRIMLQYNSRDIPSTLLVGSRIYNGMTYRKQGLASSADGPDFSFSSAESLEGSDFLLPSRNASFFIENLFNVNKYWSITPGIRYEWIRTEAKGYYRKTLRDLAENVISDEKIYESNGLTRQLVLMGLGLSYKSTEDMEIYANYSQNYRAINFNDIRVTIGNLVVDENLRDERGFNLDLGVRGSIIPSLELDGSLFYLKYRDRIGTILRREPNPVFNNLTDRIIRYRTNIADANIFGVETIVQWHFLKNSDQCRWHGSVFTNFSMTHATYDAPGREDVHEKEVELVPPYMLKAGVDLGRDNWHVNLLYSYVAQHYSDASNARFTPSAIEGLIPQYNIVDLSFRYQISACLLEAGINNLLDARYFTRRATGYPGPGIIPSEGRSLYCTIGYTL